MKEWELKLNKDKYVLESNGHVLDDKDAREVAQAAEKEGYNQAITDCSDRLLAYLPELYQQAIEMKGGFNSMVVKILKGLRK